MIFFILYSNTGLLADIQRVLKPGGNLSITNSTNISTLSTSNINSTAILTGYTSIASTTFPLTYQRPTWAPNTAAKLNLKKSTNTSANTVINQVVQVIPTGWNTINNNNDLIDEDSLLDNSETFNKIKNDDDAGCNTKRRACKNCSCGRKELEDNAVTIDTNDQPVKSSCGNCAKGDAFRCSTCPHLGKPAWNPDTTGAILLDTTASDF